jgi:hypothetical protein
MAMAGVIDREGEVSRWMGKTAFYQMNNTCSSRSLPKEQDKIDGLSLTIAY